VEYLLPLVSSFWYVNWLPPAIGVGNAYLPLRVIWEKKQGQSIFLPIDLQGGMLHNSSGSNYLADLDKYVPVTQEWESQPKEPSTPVIAKESNTLKT